MNKGLCALIFFCAALCYLPTFACPSCIGKLDNENTPPFFSNEFYQPDSSSAKIKPLHSIIDDLDELAAEKTEALQE